MSQESGCLEVVSDEHRGSLKLLSGWSAYRNLWSLVEHFVSYCRNGGRGIVRAAPLQIAVVGLHGTAVTPLL